MILKFILNSILVLILFSFKSCTHSLNIDDKLFVSGIGVDINDDGDFFISLMYPDISEFSLESSKIKGEGNVFGSGKTFYEALDEIISKINKRIDLEHVKIIVASSKLTNDEKNFEKLADYLSHNSQISRRIYFSILDGEINDFINFKPSSGEHIQVFVSELLEHNGKENGINAITLNDLFKNFSQDKTILIPVMKLSEDKKSISINGSFVFHNFKFLKSLNIKDNMIISFLRGEGEKIFDNLNFNERNLDFECANVNRKIRVNGENGLNVFLNFYMKTIIKNCINPNHDNLNENFIINLKMFIDEDIRIKSMALLNEFYQDKIDILNIYNHVYKFKNKFWSNYLKHRDSWIRELKVDIKIDNNITNIGNISF